MKIGIVGVGMVGGTLSYGFRRIGHDVIEHDLKLDSSLHDVLIAPIVFICLPTPQNKDGSCDTLLVEEAIEDLASYHYKGLAVIKSTVTPGTTDRLRAEYGVRLAFCPEFLRERAAFTDFVDQHDVCIIGACNDADDDLVRQAHGSLPKQFAKVTTLEAEFCKYFANVFNALRIVFANQFYEVCQAVGADYSAVKDAIVKRSNIGDHYLQCAKQFRAFGGNCLPKDTAAFAHYVGSLGLDHLQMFARLVEDNEAIKARTS